MLTIRVDTETGEQRSYSRRFNLGDALLLIAALGSILAFNRALGTTERLAYDIPQWRKLLGYLLFDIKPDPWYRSSLTKLQVFRYLAGDIWSRVDLILYSLLFSITPFVLLMRLRKPRPTLRVVMRQSGTTASFAAVVGCWISWSARYLLIRLPAPLVCIGGAVAIVWIFLKLCKLRERELGWIDRVGRVLGCGWIYLATAYAIRLAWSYCDPDTASWSFRHDWSFWWH